MLVKCFQVGNTRLVWIVDLPFVAYMGFYLPVEGVKIHCELLQLLESLSQESVVIFLAVMRTYFFVDQLEHILEFRFFESNLSRHIGDSFSELGSTCFRSKTGIFKLLSFFFSLVSFRLLLCSDMLNLF